MKSSDNYQHRASEYRNALRKPHHVLHRVVSRTTSWVADTLIEETEFVWNISILVSVLIGCFRTNFEGHWNVVKRWRRQREESRRTSDFLNVASLGTHVFRTWAGGREDKGNAVARSKEKQGLVKGPLLERWTTILRRQSTEETKGSINVAGSH